MIGWETVHEDFVEGMREIALILPYKRLGSDGRDNV